MSALTFVLGAAPSPPSRDRVEVGPAFLPDRACNLGTITPGALFRAAAEEVARDGAREVVVLTDDGAAHVARFTERGELAEPLAASTSLGAIFVYGTLRSGEARSALMHRHGPLRAIAATVPGRLLDLGAYPGLLPGGRDAAARVTGELYTTDDPAELLRELDEVEDFLGYGVSGSLFRRSIVRARTASGEGLAWTYVYAAPIFGARVIDSGDWKRR